MNSFNKNILICQFLLAFFTIVPFVLTHAIVLDYVTYNYLILQFLLLLLLFSLRPENRSHFLFSPSFIAVSYLNINFLLGSIAFKNGQVNEMMWNPYLDWANSNFATGYFNLANFLIINTYFIVARVKIKNVKPAFNISAIGPRSMIVFGLLIIILFSVIPLKLPLLGGQGSFSIIPKTLGAIIIFVTYFRHYNLTRRIICYAVVILLFGVSSPDNKREAIFLLLPIMLLESTQIVLTFRLKKILIIPLIAAPIIYLILVLSILRGYGNFNPTGFADATQYVVPYIQSDNFLESFFKNVEVSYVYFHSNNAIEHIFREPSKLAFGETIIKPLFILVPRSIFPHKPDGIIDLYTTSFSPTMRAEGISWPVAFQSEMFWNFHFFGVVALVFFFIIFNVFYKNLVQLILSDRIINHIPALFIYELLLVLFRGSGIDLFLIHAIFAIVIFYLLTATLRIAFTKRRTVD